MATTQNFKDWPQWWHNIHGDVRVMTISENYVMARRAEEKPFVKHVSNFKNEFHPGKRRP